MSRNETSVEAGSVGEKRDGRPYGRQIVEFLRYKRALGFKYAKEETCLWQFSRMCARNGWDGPDLPKEAVERWCEPKPGEDGRGNSHASRVSVIRQFAMWVLSMGHDAWVPASVERSLSRRSPFVARVFTREEVARLMDAAGGICPNPMSTMHLVMPTLLRLLYSSGTRIGETLAVDMDDVDLEAGVVRLTHTKGGKERFIPLSDSMSDVLGTFCSILHPEPGSEEPLFCNAWGERYDKRTIYTRFRELLRRAGIQHGGRGVGPRIHDLRHTMACHTLQNAARAGVDLRAELPVLSAYLGHASVAATCRYLQMTAEVYPDIATLVEQACAGIIPEVSADDSLAD